MGKTHKKVPPKTEGLSAACTLWMGSDLSWFWFLKSPVLPASILFSVFFLFGFLVRKESEFSFPQ